MICYLLLRVAPALASTEAVGGQVARHVVRQVAGARGVVGPLPRDQAAPHRVQVGGAPRRQVIADPGLVGNGVAFRRRRRARRRCGRRVRAVLQVRVLQEAHGVRALRRIPMHAAEDEVAQRRRQVVGERRRRRRPRDVEQGGHGRLELMPRRLAGDHLDDRAPDRPDVGLAAVPDLLDDLGRHPVGRTVDGAALRLRDVGQAGGGAEIRQLADAVRVDEDVGALDVPVHDLVPVQVLEPVQDLPGVHAHQVLVELPEPLDDRRDRPAGDVLEENVQRVGGPFCAIVLDNVLVLQRLQDGDLLDERLHELVRVVASVGVVDRQGDLLGGEPFAFVRVQRQVDGAERARPEQLTALPGERGRIGDRRSRPGHLVQPSFALVVVVVRLDDHLLELHRRQRHGRARHGRRCGRRRQGLVRHLRDGPGRGHQPRAHVYRHDLLDVVIGQHGRRWRRQDRMRGRRHARPQDRQRAIVVTRAALVAVRNGRRRRAGDDAAVAVGEDAHDIVILEVGIMDDDTLPAAILLARVGLVGAHHARGTRSTGGRGRTTGYGTTDDGSVERMAPRRLGGPTQFLWRAPWCARTGCGGTGLDLHMAGDDATPPVCHVP